MGEIACCLRPTNEEEKNLERNRFPQIIKNLDHNNKNNFNFFTEKTTNIKYNNNDIDNDDYNDEDITREEKIKKIQSKYHSHYLKKKFQNEIKPKIVNKTTNYINKLREQCGQTIIDDDFSPDGWKKYYPSNEEFFLYDKGPVFKKQIRISNQNDPNNLEIYEGETNMDNLKHGFGTLTTPYYILKGSWRNDKFTGWGRKTMRNGDILEGKFIDGELNGKGIFTNKENNNYIGDFVNSMRCGKGETTTDKYHYVGDFKDDKLNGYGVIDFFSDKQRYEGEFENNEINGKGVYKWKNGDIYEGEMKDGKMNGFGKYSYSDGKVYEGEYINGFKQGKGKLTYPGNREFEGNFDNGVPNGEGFYTKDGQTSKVLFSNGQFVKLLD